MALMKLEKWTEKASEALVKAGELAWEYQHGQAEREHMLVALLEQEGGAVAGMVQKGGGDLITAQHALYFAACCAYRKAMNRPSRRAGASYWTRRGRKS